MAHTTHGHHIDGSVKEKYTGKVARCGGPGMCPICSRQANLFVGQMKETRDGLTKDLTGHNEDTMRKVREALKKTGLRQVQIIDAINNMQNEGILFRERI